MTSLKSHASGPKPPDETPMPTDPEPGAIPSEAPQPEDPQSIPSSPEVPDTEEPYGDPFEDENFPV